ncbi:hypothetical protein [Oribacterium sp. FC2011]|uniref:hypothetical protein n=1 Tax=Oribacterium sp. FC2011 TaxID=1408311 RepID=UPI0004E18A07|nr:hypothetical protein [Oribacterium sp. FC2011]
MYKNAAIVNHLFIFFCFFPFLGIGKGTDMQPFALLFAFLIILIEGKLRLFHSKYIVSLSIIITMISIISIAFVPIAAIIKRLFSYVSVIIVFLVAASLFDREKYTQFERVSKLYNWIWFFAGLVQTFISRNFLLFLIPSHRTTANRGVCGLASEPSFYGYMCFFFFIFALSYKEHKHLYCALSVIQVLLFSQSTTALLYFVVFAGVYTAINVLELKPLHILYVLIAAVVVVILLHYLMTTRENSRMVQIILRLLSDPMAFFSTDASASSRLNSIIRSFSRHGVPTPIGSGGNLLHSGFGSVFYELGVFSLLFFIPIWKSIYSGYANHRLGKAITITVTIVMLSGIQLSLPLAAMYYGMCATKTLDSKELS